MTLAPLGLLLAGGAHAAELWGTGALASSTVQVDSDLEVRYHHVPEKLEHFEDRNIHDYVEQVERVNLLLNKEGLTIGLQVDEVALFANRYILDGELYHSNTLYSPDIVSPWKDALVRIEKAYFQRRFDHVDLTLGDTYASFGRGMALNIVRNTDVDIDTSIRGVRAELRSADMQVTAVTGLSNTQDISQDNPNVNISVDPQHVISGLRVEHYAMGPFTVGAHGVLYRFGRATDAGNDGWVQYEEDLDAVASGVSLEAPGLLGVDWALEGDVFGYRADEIAGAEGDDDGYALYGSAGAYPGPLVVLVEAKHTKNTERLNAFVTSEGWEVASVPTLEYERVITEDASAVVNSNDVTAARVRFDLGTARGKPAPYLSVAAFRDEDIGGLHFNASPETVVHGVSGVQWLNADRVLQLNAGFRQDTRDDTAEGVDRLYHVDAELHVPVGLDGIELALGARKFEWGENPGQQEDFVEMENALGYHRGEQWVLLIYQDYSNNPLIRSEGNVAEKVYGAAELAYKRSPTSEFKLFYGAYKAGIRCSGGQCRSLPGFEGGRFSWKTTF